MISTSVSLRTTDPNWVTPNAGAMSSAMALRFPVLIGSSVSLFTSVSLLAKLLACALP
jgi:hypothetical protein